MVCYFRDMKGCAVVSYSLLSDLVFYGALRVFPQRIEYAERLLSRLHRIPLLALDERIKQHSISVGAWVKDNANAELGFHPQLA